MTELLTNWRSHLTHERRRSVHTVRAYVGDGGALLSHFLNSIAAVTVDVTMLATVDAADLRAFLADRRG
ncbi:MAG: site-specific integrase, partial [Sphingopyxis sp.]|nr:site-specific integrase [Sphingopyxis sp.]